MNEFALIDLIRTECALQRSDVALSIGDDAAVVNVPSGQQLVVCTDTLIAGRHFPINTRATDIGWKSLAVNLSDLAAMGAAPAWALIALSLPESDADWVRDFARGFAELAAVHEVALVGGDTTRGPLAITVTALGHVPAGQALTRAGAGVGDAILICGRLGEAAAGLAYLGHAPMSGRNGQQEQDARARHWVNALNRPTPLLAVGRALRGIASSAIDVSDGLLADLGHVMRASGVGAEIELDSLPGYIELRDALGVDVARDCVLAGGDDYALCCTVPASGVDAAIAAVRQSGCADVSVIGRVLATPGVKVRDYSGQHIIVERTGWNHFE